MVDETGEIVEGPDTMGLMFSLGHKAMVSFVIETKTHGTEKKNFNVFKAIVLMAKNMSHGSDSPRTDVDRTVPAWELEGIMWDLRAHTRSSKDLKTLRFKASYNSHSRKGTIKYQHE